jgi:hypothetical protein
MSGTSYRVDENLHQGRKDAQVFVPGCGKEGQTIEFMLSANVMRKGQVERLAGSDAMSQAKFIASLFQIAA